ncbi:MAG: adenylate kinase [Candidatus Woesearchaeota archaeon]
MRMIIVGPPGGGKGTQAKRISENLKIPHISTGDIFRENMDQETDLGKKAKEYIDDGKLVPDDVTIAMVKDRLSKDDCSNGFLLDGFPRTLHQAEELDKFSDIDKVIQIDVPDEMCIERIAGRAKEGQGRSDDNEETARQRLDVYHDQTEPIISHYSEKEIVDKIDGTGSVDDVWEKISSVLS